MKPVPQAQCDHILGYDEDADYSRLIRTSHCLPPRGTRFDYPDENERFPHCPMCGCLNLSPTLIDELWKRHDEAREADEAERKRLLTWPI